MTDFWNQRHQRMFVLRCPTDGGAAVIRNSKGEDHVILFRTLFRALRLMWLTRDNGVNYRPHRIHLAKFHEGLLEYADQVTSLRLSANVVVGVFLDDTEEFVPL